MDTKRVNIFVFDSKENFERSKKSLAREGRTCKSLILVEDGDHFEKELAKLNDDDLVFFVVHVFATDNIRGIKEFKASAIIDDYPRLQIAFVSDGIEMDIKHKMLDAGFETTKIYKYHNIVSGLAEGELQALKKSELKEGSDGQASFPNGQSIIRPNNYPPMDTSRRTENSLQIKKKHFDYAVITALYNDEFTELKKFFDFPEKESFDLRKLYFHTGYHKTKKEKKIVVATQVATGMVDAGVLATIMLEQFEPTYLIMTGVCGGLPEHEFGDIILANSVHTFQKGKINDVPTPKENKKNDEPATPFVDRDGKPVDLDLIFTIEGQHVAVSAEIFDKEPEVAQTLQIGLQQKIEHHLEDISRIISEKVNVDSFFNKERKVTARIAPMACSTMVINKGDYFEKHIKPVNRKIAAVEMESYGVARACSYANEGRTIPIIFKAVMDKTVNKSDTIEGFNAKKFAAFASANFLSLLLEKDVI